MSTEQRINFSSVSPQSIASLYAAARHLATSSLEPQLQSLVQLRASNINGCAFCLELHRLEAEAVGVSRERIQGIAAWHETTWYSDRERAALAWTDALTNIATTHAPDDVYDEVRRAFSEREMVDLTLAITTINSWNRFAIGFRADPRGAAQLFESLQKQPAHA
ncbi:MAG: carboxymuconolactone decarboxylase family protein [Candidatus Eremiobacteraeota bacterium]|nr:carboxymuconolactone decarboxylase family protein [Candidatus Eremiobacteraeota bacterium]MBV9407666.1 carboxymuconolactone decarboxylase family protein [Candidatus Eremiobacteraeota bacterium]